MSKTDSPDETEAMAVVAGALLRRKAAICDERDELLRPLKPQLDRLNEELRGIDHALSVVQNPMKILGRPAEPKVAVSRGTDVSKCPRVTHRVLALLALAGRGDEGASVAYIVTWAGMANVTEDPVVRTSMSPLLRKLSDPDKHKLEVRHDDKAHLWYITERGLGAVAAFRQEWLAAGRHPFWEIDVALDGGGE